MLAALAGAPLFGQGVASRGVKATARGKPSGKPFLSKFTDVAAEAGLRAPVIYGGVETNTYILESVGCGMAFLDYDNDGWLDILVLSRDPADGIVPGAHEPAVQKQSRRHVHRCHRKGRIGADGWASAVTVGDYDNDGFEDLFITYWGQNVLYRNNGDGTFTDVTRRRVCCNAQTRWGSGCTWVDYDRDGKLDLFVANYLDFDTEEGAEAGREHELHVEGGAGQLRPAGIAARAGHFLYHNNGDGTFTDVTRQSGSARPKGSYCMTSVAADFDNDGWPDIYVACDSTPSFYFRNKHDGTFREEGLERGTALNEDGMEQAGMGLGIGDFDLDGNLRYLQNALHATIPRVVPERRQGHFRGRTIRAGLGVETRYVGWGAGIVDLDNDGFPNLRGDRQRVSGGGGKVPPYPYKTPRCVFRNLGNGKFEE